jgi:hypothetical protein
LFTGIKNLTRTTTSQRTKKSTLKKKGNSKGRPVIVPISPRYVDDFHKLGAIRTGCTDVPSHFWQLESALCKSRVQNLAMTNWASHDPKEVQKPHCCTKKEEQKKEAKFFSALWRKPMR